MNASSNISRYVAFLTPAFSGLAGWLCTLAAQYLPGAPDLDETQLTGIFVTGAGAAAAAAWKWLDGRSKFERGVS